MWSILMLFLKTVVTVEQTKLDQPLYFNKKKLVSIIYFNLNKSKELESVTSCGSFRPGLLQGSTVGGEGCLFKVEYFQIAFNAM